MKRESIIIDTDIGDDIDDALAIAFALQCPELRILGITTVFGNTRARAKIAANLLAIAGLPEIPVYAGCGQPLNESKNLEELPCQYIEEEMADLPTAAAHAADYLISAIMESEEPVTVLAIGPLTNLAVALLKEPRLKKKLNKIVIMGGAYYFHFLEWNIKCDPEAAHIVFTSGIPLTAVGLDVTKRCLMNADQLSRLEQGKSPVMHLLQRLIHEWQRNTNRTYPILHDALAVYGVFGRELLHFDQESVQVELAGRLTRGMTFNLTDRDREDQLIADADRLAGLSVIRTARKVEAQAFISLFLERLGQNEGGDQGHGGS